MRRGSTTQIRQPPSNRCSVALHHGAWDLSNVIGACLQHAESTVGCRLGWLSWVTDYKTDAGTDRERLIRVYAHISSGSLADQAATLAANDLRMVPMGSGLPDNELHWVRCWQESRDIAGTPVRRGFGFALDRGHEMEGWQRDHREGIEGYRGQGKRIML